MVVKKKVKDKDIPSITSIEEDLQSDSEQPRSDLSEGVLLLLNERYKRRKTILNNDRKISGITTLEVLAQLYDIEFLKNWIDWYCEFMTSSGGIGRKDIVDMFKFSYAERSEKENRMLDHLAGRGR